MNKSGYTPTDTEISYNFLEISSEENKQKLTELSADIKSVVRKCLENGCDGFELIDEIPDELPVHEIADELTLI